jgi:nitrate/TMAO reductase-like tetraheme cytochrome c subunit
MTSADENPENANEARRPVIPSPLSVPPMPQPESASRQQRRWPFVLAFVGVALLSLGGIGFAAATALEEHDPFCVACHTVPEITYFNRAYIALDNPELAIPDLSTAHYHAAQAQGLAPFRCIDCHRGDSSLGHRVATVALGARDALIFFLGREDPTIEKHNTESAWLANASCSGCHAETLLRLDGINNHFHSYLPEARVALDRGGTLVIGDALREALAGVASNPESVTGGLAAEELTTLRTIPAPLQCSSCHQAHHAQLDGALTFFMNADLRNVACVDCHLAAGEGPQDVRSLSGE